MGKVFNFSGSLQSNYGINDKVAKEISGKLEDLLRCYGEYLDSSYCLRDFRLNALEKLESLQKENAELREELRKETKAIDDAMNWANGRWCEWGSRAGCVEDILSYRQKERKDL